MKYVLQYIHHFRFSSLIFWMLVFVKHEVINFWSPIEYTSSIDLLSIRTSIEKINIRTSKQSKHTDDQQAKRQRESALSCVKKYALCCTWRLHRTTRIYAAVINWVGAFDPFADGWVTESRSRQTWILRGSDSPLTQRPATNGNVLDTWRWL